MMLNRSSICALYSPEVSFHVSYSVSVCGFNKCQHNIVSEVSQNTEIVVEKKKKKQNFVELSHLYRSHIVSQS